MKWIMACDESGAKGYADQREAYPGELGVFAGLLVPDVVLDRTEEGLASAIAPFRTMDGKLHIAALTPRDQAAMRTAIFAVIRSLHLPCFWYAIHVDGLNAHHIQMEKLLEGGPADGLAKRPSAGRRQPELLHVELFRALYGYMVAFIEERAPGDVIIEARTDRVDKPIARSFRAEAARLFETVRTSTIKGYDHERQQPVKCDIRFESHIPSELQFRTKVKALDLRIVDDSDAIVVAADVLANSLHHHFRSRDDEQRYADLNRPPAVAGHPLATNLDTFWNWGGDDLIGDRMFRHPKASSLPR